MNVTIHNRLAQIESVLPGVIGRRIMPSVIKIKLANAKVFSVRFVRISSFFKLESICKFILLEIRMFLNKEIKPSIVIPFKYIPLCTVNCI